MGNPVTSGYSIIRRVTLSTPTGALADNDVAADTQVIENVFIKPRGMVRLDSLVLLDEGDQAAETDLIFLSADVSVGTEDGAVSITDANARKIIGAINIPTTAYFDLINSQVAVVRDIMLSMEGETTSLYVAAVTRGTPTYGATDALKLQLHFTAFA